MSFTLEKVVPWGRSFEEYVSMFCLSKNDLNLRILGCGDGPASFNAELTHRGGNIISTDPLYQFSASEIKTRIKATYHLVLEQTKKNQAEFLWKQIKTIEELGCVRMAAMAKFLEDYPHGRERYVTGELPWLPFSDNAFDMALCSHFLFLYSEQYSSQFHVQSIIELCRVAREVRIFPVLELGTKRSRHLESVIKELNQKGYQCVLKKVNYEFQKGGNQMLYVKP